MNQPRLKACWIGPSAHPKDDLGAFAFKLDIPAGTSLESLDYWISADQRFKLYLDGQLIHVGPARGDAQHWFAEQGTLPPLDSGSDHTLIAVVWNFGRWAPMAQCTVRTGFFFECEGLSTPGAWQVAPFPGLDFSMQHSHIGNFYIDIGPGEVVSTSFDIELLLKLDYEAPNVISSAEWREHNRGGTPWFLIPRSLPTIPIPEPGPLAVATGLAAQFEFDLGTLRAGYPIFAVSNPHASPLSIHVTFAEARQTPTGEKRHRDDKDGTQIRGIQDTLIVAPQSTLTWEPLWWRTARFIALSADASFDIVGSAWRDRGTSLVCEALFESDNAMVQAIAPVALRTLELCAEETYFDCPYYEQLQYAGDTRIQALCGYYLSPRRELQRQAIDQFFWSIGDHGFTMSRYPSRQAQVIPPFSLFWVLMVFDAWMHDPDFSPTPYLAACERIVEQFHANAADSIDWDFDTGNGFWPFCDWVPDWRGGVPPGGLSAEVHQLTALWASTALKRMKGQEPGTPSRPPRRPDEPMSEHAEAIWRCIQREHGITPDPWPELDDHTPRCTYYFSYYRHMAMAPDDYLGELGPWQDMLDIGLTTFAENPEPTRSDCHGWSAHPILGFHQFIAGITSLAPGWAKVGVAPKLGHLPGFRSVIPHPQGKLVVEACPDWIAIDSPVPVQLVWKGRNLELEGGSHRIS